MKKNKVSDYAGTAFIGIDDVRDAPLQETITDVEEGNYGKLVATLKSGRLFSLNVTNTRTLLKAFGDGDGSQWVGKRIELFAGQTTFQGQPKESVLVRAISGSEAAPTAQRSRPKKTDDDDEPPRRRKKDEDLDDEIPL